MEEQETQVSCARRLLRRLWALGMREVCVCAGSRNAPFVELLSTVTDLTVWWGFEERSAGFFAVGRARRIGSPVGVITTSGTAVAELLPPVIEAFYSGVPLVVVSCDRPAAWGGTGSPQTIEQVGIFSRYARTESIDAKNSSPEVVANLVLASSGPSHLNIHLDEPLLDDPGILGRPWRAGDLDLESRHSVAAAERLSNHTETRDILRRFFDVSAQPLCLVGPLRPAEAKLVLPFVTQLPCPVWAEPTSQLREEPSIRVRLIPWGEHTARAIEWDGVLRIGGVPTARVWRDLEKNNIPVVSCASSPYWPGMAREHPVLPLEALYELSLESTKHTTKLTETGAACVGEIAHRVGVGLASLMESYPRAEPSLLRALSRLIPEGASVYLGNSLPIREWDWAAVSEKRWTYGYNRGANGIDGQLSTFLGWSDPSSENWAIVGDLTALYDLAAPWYARALRDTTLRVVVVNNSGGQIFSRLYRNPAFVNEHDVQFRSVAEMWGWGYSVWDGERSLGTLARHHLIEVRVDNRESEAMYERLARLHPPRAGASGA